MKRPPAKVSIKFGTIIICLMLVLILDLAIQTPASNNDNNLNSKNNLISDINKELNNAQNERNSQNGENNENNKISGDGKNNQGEKNNENNDDISEESKAKLNDWKLKLVNFENEMESDYIPELGKTTNGLQFDKRAVDYLNQMVKDMKAQGISHIWPQSTYRNPKKQVHLYQQSIEERIQMGESKEEAENYTASSIAKPYRSEHNLGLAVDFNNVDNAFEAEPAFNWLVENAQNYGFILRYPKDKEDITKIKYEPWHWRYVGTEYAKEINEKNMCLEEYIEYLKAN